VGFEVLMAVNMKTAAFRDVTPCSLVERYQYFGGASYLDLLGRTVDIYETKDTYTEKGEKETGL
jgi:hypothetical protein